MNHGIEIHDDVVAYARAKLSQFMRSSPAVDLCEFCAPTFSVGNCLQLEASTSWASYDRVYCGAAVLDHQQDFVRQLVKVGGIAVMPCGDQVGT